MYYNIGNMDQTWRVAPAMKAGAADHIWLIDEINDYIRIFANEEGYRFLGSIRMTGSPGWITMGLGGRYAYISSGDVPRARTPAHSPRRDYLTCIRQANVRQTAWCDEEYSSSPHSFGRVARRNV